MILQNEQQASSRVEISGWDTNENFFVEKTEIHASHEGRRRVDLHTRLRTGALVFLRISDDFSLGRAIPIAYQVVRVLPRAVHGTHEVHLARLHPRERRQTAIHEFASQSNLPN